MPVSTATGRQVLTTSVPWQLAFRMALLLLFEMWDLTDNEIVQIYHALFPITHEYWFNKLRDQYNQRWSGGRRERHWRVLDRPNTFDASPYTNQELLDFAAGVTDIAREANALNIQLTLKVPATHQLLTHVPAGTAGLPAATASASAPIVTAPPPASTLAGPSYLPASFTAPPPGALGTAMATQTTSGSAVVGFIPVPPAIPMVHGRDVSFSEGGASYFPHPSSIFGGASATVDVSSALYALGGPLHLVADAPGLLEPGEYASSTLAAVTVCNVGCCGVCNQDAPSIDNPITGKTEDRLLLAVNAAILDLRGRPLIHRRDLSGAVHDPRQNLKRQLTTPA